jgi:hypothetical protein
MMARPALCAAVLLAVVTAGARAPPPAPPAPPPAHAVDAPPPPAEVYVVDLSASPPPQTVLAVQACAGLLNRAAGNNNGTGNASAVVYTLMHGEDAGWLATVLPSLPSPPLVFDALARWGTPDPNATGAALNATADAFALFGARTAGMAKMNPGFTWLSPDGATNPAPPLTGAPDLSLGDHVVAARLFNFYLPNGCVPLTDENALLVRMVGSGAPPSWGAPPFAVLGYDDTWPLFGGDVFEAETACDLAAPSMGQVATSGVNNLAFFAATAPRVTAPLAQPPLPPAAFNASRTYVAFTVGDGDNVAYVKSTRRTWFAARAAACAARTPLCAFPLAWSLSPHLATLAPAILRWYYAVANATGRDYFVLPPSGHLYAYAALMPPAVQAAFVAATEADAALLNTSTSVEWEVMGTWAAAVADYAPRYARRGQVRGLLTVNVPYMVPVLEFGAGETVKVLNGSVAMFAPLEWRGTAGGGPAPFMQNASAWAAQLNGMPAGSLVSIYMTSDGGAQWQDFGDLAAALAGHVEVVPPDTLAALAVERDAARRAQPSGAAG